MASSPRTKRRRKNETKESTTDMSSPSSSVEKLSPVVVFAHGAGAPSSSNWMISMFWWGTGVFQIKKITFNISVRGSQRCNPPVVAKGLFRWKDMLGKALHAIEVVTFDYPYISGGKRKAPPKAEKLVDFHSDIVKKTVAKFPGHPLILAGKSMGSRVSCMVAAEEDVDASAVICLGYPLKGVNGAMRDQPLLQLAVPIMLVQGSKDGLCPLEKLEDVRKKMRPLSWLHVVDGGDHSFKIGKKHLQTKGSTQYEAEDLAVKAIQSFVSKALGVS